MPDNIRGAALDILEYLGLIRAISSKGISPIYAITNQELNIISKNYTLDHYVKQMRSSHSLKNQNEYYDT